MSDTTGFLSGLNHVFGVPYFRFGFIHGRRYIEEDSCGAYGGSLQGIDVIETTVA
jgi:hypothetical protein